MKISHQYAIDLRTTSVMQLPVYQMNDLEMILPGASTSTCGSCSCSCGAVVTQ